MTDKRNEDVQLFQITARPGIRRDGTRLDGGEYTDGRWVRFYRGKPRKMGGYRRITNQMTGPSRALYVYKRQDLYSVYNFHTSGLEVLSVDTNGSGSSPTARTPAGFTTSANNLWQFDSMFDTTGGGNAKIIAHAGQTALNIDDRTDLPVYIGNLNDAAALTAIAGQTVSGGCVVLQPYLFIYGNDGLIKNSDRGNPTNFTTGGASEANAVNVAGTKIVKGLPLRGGGQTPAGLFWSLESLIRVAFIGGTKIFSYDTVSAQTSILAQNSPIEYDGTYYWIGADRFLAYAGTVREVPNQLNLDWFFQELNWEHRNKIFATKVPRHGEVWWLFPRGSSTECNHAIIYNVRENTWYDTPLSRASGYYSQTFRYPVMMGTAPLTVGNPATYPIYLHEFGKDAVEGDIVSALESFFETADFGLASGGPVAQDQPVGLDQWLRIERFEPDFRQAGEMQLIIKGQPFANSSATETVAYPFLPTTERVDVRHQFRHLRLKCLSNAFGGDYVMGRPLISGNPGDVRE